MKHFKITGILILLILILGGLYFVGTFLMESNIGERAHNILENSQEKANTTVRDLSAYDPVTVEIHDQEFTLARADSPQLRQSGLSHIESLHPYDGMIFVFDELDTYGFWMKDMRFDLDIIWIDTDGVIVYLKEDLTPQSYPTVFRPDNKALYVLEFEAGWVREYGVNLGDIVHIVD